METQSKGDVSRDEKIGFHKGAIDSLIKERQELIRLLSIVEQLVKIHINALKELGIDIERKMEK